MAIQTGTEFYTKWTHVENGQVMVRRLHQFQIQPANGRMYSITGKDLPDFLLTNTGEGSKGRHLATILLTPNKASRLSDLVDVPTDPRLWPSSRDVLHVLLGFCFTLGVRIIAQLIEQASPY